MELRCVLKTFILYFDKVATLGTVDLLYESLLKGFKECKGKFFISCAALEITVIHWPYSGDFTKHIQFVRTNLLLIFNGEAIDIVQ